MSFRRSILEEHFYNFCTRWKIHVRNAILPVKFRGKSVETDFRLQWAGSPHFIISVFFLALTLIVSAVSLDRVWVWLDVTVAILAGTQHYAMRHHVMSYTEPFWLFRTMKRHVVVVLGIFAMGRLLLHYCIRFCQAEMWKENHSSPAAWELNVVAMLVVIIGYDGPHAVRTMAEKLVFGLAITASIIWGGGVAVWPIALMMLILTAMALHARREASLELKVLYLRQRRMVDKASQYHELLTQMLPPQLVYQYAQACLTIEKRLVPVNIKSMSMGKYETQAGVLFTAIDDFDAELGDCSAHALVCFLNLLFSAFDQACEEAGPDVLKIETVGEVYVAACGLFTDVPSPGKVAFTQQLVSLARVAHQMHLIADDAQVKLRVGLHSGPLVAGIVGDKLPRFRLFGDTMNMAARLEQKCPSGGVLVSAPVVSTLESSGKEFMITSHGTLELKGIGLLETFLLEQRVSLKSLGSFEVMTLADLNEKELPFEKGKLRRTISPTSWLTPTSQLGHEFSGRRWSGESFLSSSASEPISDEPVPRSMSDNSIGSGSNWALEERDEATEIVGLDSKVDESMVAFRFRDAADESAFQRVYFHARRTGRVRRDFCVAGLCCLPLLLTNIPENPRQLCFGCLLMLLSGVMPRVMKSCSPGVSSHAVASLLMSGSFFTARGAGGLLGACLIWVLLLLGVLARIPFETALVISGVTFILPRPDGTNWIVLNAVFLALHWAEEQVARRRFLVKKLESGAQDRMQEVAENLMPPLVVRQIRRSQFGHSRMSHERSLNSCVAHDYDRLTVLQTDLVGFTQFARTKEPREVMCVINGLFSVFDKLVEDHHVYKMETIGDAYVCISGLPDYNDGVHSASTMLVLGTEFVAAVKSYYSKCGLPIEFGLRVGVHSGRGVGGVVGKVMQRYHIFGSLMRIVEVLEATAPTDNVHVSATTRKAHMEEVAQADEDFPGDVPDAAFHMSLDERDNSAGLTTSKGDVLPVESVGNLSTYLVSERGLERAQSVDSFSRCAEHINNVSEMYRVLSCADSPRRVQSCSALNGDDDSSPLAEFPREYVRMGSRSLSTPNFFQSGIDE